MNAKNLQMKMSEDRILDILQSILESAKGKLGSSNADISAGLVESISLSTMSTLSWCEDRLGFWR